LDPSSNTEKVFFLVIPAFRKTHLYSTPEIHKNLCNNQYNPVLTGRFGPNKPEGLGMKIADRLWAQ
jgi:hypothetical protein